VWSLFSYPIVLVAAGIFVPWIWIAGNLLAAKLLGAPVLRAGLGIGPALVERRWGATSLRLSLIPFGGTFSLESRPERGQVLRRMLLTFVGPLCVLLATVLGLFLLNWSNLPATAPAAVVGHVQPGTPAAAAKLQPGDTITAVEGRPIRFWSELRNTVAARPGQATRLTIERTLLAGVKTLRLSITPRGVSHPSGERVGQIGIMPDEVASQIGIGDSSGGGARAGLLTGDVILEVNGRSVRRWSQLAQELRRGGGEVLRLSYARPAMPGLEWPEILALPRHEASVTPRARQSPLRGILPGQHFVARVLPGAPQAVQPIVAGSRITQIDGTPVERWRRRGKQREHNVQWTDPYGLQQRTQLSTAELERVRPLLFPFPPRGRWVRYWALFVAPPELPADSSAGAVWRRTRSLIEGSYAAVLHLLLGHAPRKTVDGPVVITTRQAAETLPALHYLLMSLLLVTPLCMLPLPPLPGGQLPLLGIELARGRPLQQRTRLAMIFIGLGLLFLTMLFAFSRDLLRFLN
jgi:membrane-associated protease RseP (regulator of RpoE activity)